MPGPAWRSRPGVRVHSVGNHGTDGGYDQGAQHGRLAGCV